MLAKSINGYYAFGSCVRYLQDAKKGIKIHGSGYILENLNALFRYLHDLNLQVTERAAHAVREFKGNLQQTDQNATLTESQAKSLRTRITELRKTLSAELTGFSAYVVTPKRIEINRLLNDIDALFAPNVFTKLSTLAQYDFAESGKCIAFERPTAAAFHCLRATEDVLRQFYCHYARQNRCDLMWGPMVADLRKRQKTKAKATLLNNLDNIRLSFRNPTQHPEKIYDIQEVQDLWYLCVEVVNRMQREISGQAA